MRVAVAVAMAGSITAALPLSAHPASAALASEGSALAKPRTAEALRIAKVLDDWVKPLLDRQHLSGSFLVAKNEEVLFERAWGMADFELGVPNTPETRFNIASITKPMTVILATQLIIEKKFALGDSVGKWFPGFPAGDRMTVQHLLSHRSGIPHRVTTGADEIDPRTAAEMVEFARRARLEFEPGDRYAYSSGGFSVLARILELAGGRSYGELLAERIFVPIGMTRSTHADSHGILPGRAASYVPGARGMDNASLEDLSHLVGAGSVWSTPRDLHKLMWAVAGGKFGKGPQLSYVREGRLFWNGHTNGFRAFAEWDSASGYGWAFTGNLHTGACDLLRGAIRKITAGEAPDPVPSIPPSISTSDEELRRFEAVYLLPGGNTRLDTRARQGMLWSNDWVLVPTGENTFFSIRDYGEVTAVLDAAGKPDRLDWKVGGQTYACEKVEEVPEPLAR